jgi:diphthine synthase
MLYLIGLGLSDEKDITVRGLEVVRKASRVYLEAYTSILLVDKEILVRRFLAIYILRELTLMYSRRNTMAEP